MGQSASSTNHSPSNENVPQAYISDGSRANMNEESLRRTLNILTSDRGANRSQRRRRSISPDTELQRRSSRLRRRLSRLVPSAISSAGSSAGTTRNISDVNDDRNIIGTLGTSTPTTRTNNVRVNSRASPRISRPDLQHITGHQPPRPISTVTPRLRGLSPHFSRPLSTPGNLNLNTDSFSTQDDTRYGNLGYGAQNGSDSRIFADQALGASPEELETVESSQRRSRLSRLRSSLTAGSGLPNFWADEQNRGFTAEDPSLNHPTGPLGIEPLSNLDILGPTLPPPRRNSAGVPRDGQDSQPPRDHLISRARPGEDQAAMLSRLLSVAATATAASLVGSMDQAMTEARDVAGDSADGSFESFLRALQNGRLAAALRNGGNELGERIDGESNTNELALNEGGMAAPLNFFRMFRFGSNSRNNGTAANNSEGGTNEENTSRTVPVIIVGIRSVTPRDTAQQDGQATPHLFDALANLPHRNPANSAARQNQNLSPTQQPMQQRGLDPSSPTLTEPNYSSSRNDTNIAEPVLGIQGHGSTLRQTPPDFDSPLPSHSPTLPPISNLLSASRLRDYARRRSLSSTNQLSQSASTHHDQFSLRRGDSDDDGEDLHPRGSPRSHEGEGSRGQEQPRHRAGRTGDRSSANTEGTRSWIIYVLGGSYPENHPILTTPSLFTDTPTYEDMMLLSSLLGPAKPPVASQEDVESAGGIFVVGSPDSVGEIQPGDRCLVCLSDFEKGEECRRLLKCQHLFHKECIDEWLTTGRNSCPLCRAQGVNEQKSATQSPGARNDSQTVSPSR